MQFEIYKPYTYHLNKTLMNYWKYTLPEEGQSGAESPES